MENGKRILEVSANFWQLNAIHIILIWDGEMGIFEFAIMDKRKGVTFFLEMTLYEPTCRQKQYSLVAMMNVISK